MRWVADGSSNGGVVGPGGLFLQVLFPALWVGDGVTVKRDGVRGSTAQTTANCVKEALSQPRSPHPRLSQTCSNPNRLTIAWLGQTRPAWTMSIRHNVAPHQPEHPLNAGPGIFTRISWIYLFFNNNTVFILSVAMALAVTDAEVAAPSVTFTAISRLDPTSTVTISSIVLVAILNFLLAGSRDGAGRDHPEGSPTPSGPDSVSVAYR